MTPTKTATNTPSNTAGHGTSHVARKTITKATASDKAKSAPKDAIALLKVDHEAVTQLLEGSEPDGEMYDAKVKVLSEYVSHHVKEVQNEMFPKVKSSSVDIMELGARMAARKDDLLSSAA